MRNKNLLSMLFIACMVLTSCGNTVSDDVEVPGTNTEKTNKHISINLNEENTSIALSPQSRVFNTDGKRYYAINILEKDNKNYIKYAYGLFDGNAPVSAVMTEGHKYRIEVLEFRNDKDTLYHEGDMFYEPMKTSDAKATQLKNAFVYDKSVNLSGITTGDTRIGAESSDTTWYPRAYKYYAIVEEFDPSSTDKLDITVKRAFFGLHFIITPPKHGSVKLLFLRNHTIEVNATDKAYDDEAFYSFNQVSNAAVEGYGTDVAIEATWTSDGKVIKQQKEMVPIKRNAVTNLTIGFSGPKDIEQVIKEETTPLDTLNHNWVITSE